VNVPGGTGTNSAYDRQFARRSNYFMMTGQWTDYFCWAAHNGNPPNPGFFYPDLSFNISRITDGTSNSVMIGESRLEKFSSSFGPYWGTGTHTATCGSIYYDGSFLIPQFLPNAIWEDGVTPGGNPKRLQYAWGLGSLHPGGINVTMGDGSVKFIKNTISLYTWRSIHSIQGGEVISADAY